jgi:hypothetical protein
MTPGHSLHAGIPSGRGHLPVSAEHRGELSRVTSRSRTFERQAQYGSLRDLPVCGLPPQQGLAHPLDEAQSAVLEWPRPLSGITVPQVARQWHQSRRSVVAGSRTGMCRILGLSLVCPRPCPGSNGPAVRPREPRA